MKLCPDSGTAESIPLTCIATKDRHITLKCLNILKVCSYIEGGKPTVQMTCKLQGRSPSILPPTKWSRTVGWGLHNSLQLFLPTGPLLSARTSRNKRTPRTRSSFSTPSAEFPTDRSVPTRDTMQEALAHRIWIYFGT